MCCCWSSRLLLAAVVPQTGWWLLGNILVPCCCCGTERVVDEPGEILKKKRRSSSDEWICCCCWCLGICHFCGSLASFGWCWIAEKSGVESTSIVETAAAEANGPIIFGGNSFCFFVRCSRFVALLVPLLPFPRRRKAARMRQSFSLTIRSQASVAPIDQSRIAIFSVRQEQILPLLPPL